MPGGGGAVGEFLARGVVGPAVLVSAPAVEPGAGDTVREPRICRAGRVEASGDNRRVQSYAPAMLMSTPDDGRLPLDDPYWQDLDHRGGRDTPDVPTELAALVTDPDQEERFRDLWPYLCSEGSTWPAAYAATPYLVDLASSLPPERRVEHIAALGLIAAHGAPADAPDRLADAYIAGLSRAVPLAAETLAQPVATSDLVWLLAAVAALHGHAALAQVLPDLDSVCEPCPQCGTDVWFTALDNAVKVP